ncbi:MAG: phosphoenolpyruvate synthase [Lachnospiraceae bacterium]|nr:phosphoenolpyruvate synthase [Lachnospiraceae bacterium]
MSKYIRFFEDIRKEDIPSAGGKGANLGEMTAAGINIPKGGVLLAPAYDAFLSANGIEPEKYGNAKEIRDAILNGDIPGDIRSEIEEFYTALNGGTAADPGASQLRVAVRSSATAEDLEDASFAGQQETYLNVVGLRYLLDRIRQCYASLWGDRAVSYRKNAGYDKQKVSLAVVIQQMIESESAGVMFTADPAGSPENVHINASYGLGEAVVSGIVSPDEYICDREGSVLKEVIGSKEEEILYDREKNGTVSVPVDDERQRRAVLSREQIARLVREGLRVEAHYGHPMDIEWAVRDDTFYILQARSITTLQAEQAKTFSEKDFAGYPRVKPAKGAARENVLFNLEKNPTPYFPLDHDFGGFIGEQKNILFEQIGITFPGGMNPIDRDGVSYQAKSKPRLSRNVFAIPKYLRMIGDIDNNIRQGDASLAHCTAEFAEEKKKNPADAREIGEALKRMHDLIGRTAYDRFLYALFPNFIESGSVTKVLKRVDEKLNAYDILEGLSYVTADMNRVMKRLSEYIRSDEKMFSCVMEEDYQTICASFPSLEERLRVFLDRFGSKSDFNCYCFISETWRENPDRFINTLRPMVKSGADAVATAEEAKARFEELMQQVKRTVSCKQYAGFTKKVKGLRHYHYIREATQYLWESEFEHCRKLLRSLSELLDVPYDDLLYLFADELYEVCRDGSLGTKREIIERRKSKRDFAVAYWDKCMKDALSDGGDEIRGVGASTGQAKGRVCLVHSPAEFSKLEKGDILVCPYTDPEWTPLFALAGGVVVDTGGTLSHAAIVAREYGIPAVLATGEATTRLHDGNLVLVNAAEGTVIPLS